MNPKRNDPCPCGSGKRYKLCCGAASRAQATQAHNAEAIFRQAHRAHVAGQFDLAIEGYNRALALNPKHAEAVHYLGMLALGAGDVNRALALIEQSIALKPRDADFWSNQALVHEMQKDWPRARAAYEKSLALSPSHAQRELRLASALRQMGETEQAIAHYRRSIRLSPTLWPAHLDLASALLKLDPPDLVDAEACFRKVTRLAPDRAEGYNGLGVALIAQDRYDDARQALERAVSLDPSLAVAWYNLARVCLVRDDADRAIEAYEKAVALVPDYEDFYQQTAKALQMKGKFDVAEKFFAKALELNPESTRALANLVEYRKFNSLDDTLLQQAQSLVDNAGDEEPQVLGLCYSLGKILDRLNEFELAFRYYARANKLRKLSCGSAPGHNSVFIGERFSELVDKTIQQYSTENLAKYRAWGNPSDRPILIVGMPRSGTTLTEQIIATHPQVAGGGERHFWGETGEMLRVGDLTLDETGFASIAQACLEDQKTVIGARDADRVTDKMPHNFVNLGLIHSVFPNARIFHVRRHPVDTCLSIFFQNFNCAHSYSCDLEELVSHHREYQRLMAHWARVLPADRFFEFDYEALVADQEGMSRELIDFCGLEWDEACLRYYEDGRAVKTPSLHQVRQKIYTSSVERWRNYEPHIEALMKLLPDA